VEAVGGWRVLSGFFPEQVLFSEIRKRFAQGMALILSKMQDLLEQVTKSRQRLEFKKREGGTHAAKKRKRYKCGFCVFCVFCGNIVLLASPDPPPAIRMDHALADLSEHLRLHPEDPIARLSRSDLYKQRGKAK
jgi:hypothetical protein